MRQSSWLQPTAVLVHAGLQSAAFPVIPRRAGIHTGQGPGGCLYNFRALDVVGAPVSLFPGPAWVVVFVSPVSLVAFASFPPKPCKFKCSLGFSLCLFMLLALIYSTQVSESAWFWGSEG